jgi:hypothetical protein
MSLLEQIQHEVLYLPPEKQQEVLDFVRFLRERLTVRQPARRAPLSAHPAFGSWRGRKVDALKYQEERRAEWEEQDEGAL